jgi:hypothetical protein
MIFHCIGAIFHTNLPDMPATSKGTIFINYRREDSNWNALALYNELQKYFSKEQIFKDFNAIQPGDDFVESISSALQRCDVLLVLIGSKWLDIKDDEGKRRLDDANDYVRLEIAKALSRNIKVIPVMLDEARMPRSEQLPPDLQMLTRRQLVEIEPTRFEDDVRKLADAIKSVMPAGADLPKPQPVPYPPHPKPEPRPDPPVSQAKPDNNMVWGILTTIGCCLPLGIMSIISASKVDSLYQSGKYAEAQAAAAQAKKYAIWAIIGGAIGWVIMLILSQMGVFNEQQGNYYPSY